MVIVLSSIEARRIGLNQVWRVCLVTSVVTRVKKSDHTWSWLPSDGWMDIVESPFIS